MADESGLSLPRQRDVLVNDNHAFRDVATRV